jgi:SAM-dependent methyltransferase
LNKHVFGHTYAKVYDILYQDKDYESECDILEDIFRRYRKNNIKSILDLGCGTGNHAFLLAKRGYDITGVDRSSEMIENSKRKAQTESISRAQHIPSFLQGDISKLDLARKFDAVLMMFAVLGYQLTNREVLAALQTVRRHLKTDGLFVCDIWYGPAVLAIRPDDRIKVVQTSNGKIIRTASGSLDIHRHLARIHYRIWEIKESQVVNEDEEIHQMRYFFPQELAFFMAEARLSLINLSKFDGLDYVPGEDTWNVLVVGKALPIK